MKITFGGRVPSWPVAAMGAKIVAIPAIHRRARREADLITFFLKVCADRRRSTEEHLRGHFNTKAQRHEVLNEQRTLHYTSCLCVFVVRQIRGAVLAPAIKL